MNPVWVFGCRLTIKTRMGMTPYSSGGKVIHTEEMAKKKTEKTSAAATESTLEKVPEKAGTVSAKDAAKTGIAAKTEAQRPPKKKALRFTKKAKKRVPRKLKKRLKKAEAQKTT